MKSLNIISVIALVGIVILGGIFWNLTKGQGGEGSKVLDLATLPLAQEVEKVLDRKISPYTIRHTRCNIWFNSGMNAKDYELVADHTYSVAMKYYQQSNKERLQKKFDEIYNIKELTPEEKNKIRELEKRNC